MITIKLVASLNFFGQGNYCTKNLCAMCTGTKADFSQCRSYFLSISPMNNCDNMSYIFPMCVVSTQLIFLTWLVFMYAISNFSPSKYWVKICETDNFFPDFMEYRKQWFILEYASILSIPIIFWKNIYNYKWY